CRAWSSAIVLMVFRSFLLAGENCREPGTCCRPSVVGGSLCRIPERLARLRLASQAVSKRLRWCVGDLVRFRRRAATSRLVSTTGTATTAPLLFFPHEPDTINPQSADSRPTAGEHRERSARRRFLLPRGAAVGALAPLVS